MGGLGSVNSHTFSLRLGAMALPKTAHQWQDQPMSSTYGSEIPRPHAQSVHRTPSRYLVVIDAGGSIVARLFLDTRELVAEFDASTEETMQMTAGLIATRGAGGPEWDRALIGHSATERSNADVYTLAV